MYLYTPKFEICTVLDAYCRVRSDDRHRGHSRPVRSAGSPLPVLPAFRVGCVLHSAEACMMFAVHH